MHEELEACAAPTIGISVGVWGGMAAGRVAAALWGVMEGGEKGGAVGRCGRSGEMVWR